MTVRERSYSWEDPTALAAAGRDQSGLDYLRALIAGDLPLPPVCATIGFRFVEVEPGRCVMELDPGEHQYNTIGTVHGGVIVTLLDSAAGNAIHSTLPAGTGYTTVNLTTSFLRPIQADAGPLRAVGELIKAGRRMALCEARLIDADDRLYAHATANCMILEP